MGIDLRQAYTRHGDKLRFLVVGVFNTAFGYGLFLVLLYALRWALGAPSGVPPRDAGLIVRYHYLIAQWSAWVLSVPVGATTLRHFVFRSRGRRSVEIARAYMVYFPVLAISSGLLWVTVAVLGIPAELGQLITIALTTVFSYVGHKYFTFRERLDA